MNGPDALRWRGAFEAWRLADPRNARAYARQQAIWGAMSSLSAQSGVNALKPRPRLTPMRAAAALVPAALVFGGVLLWQRPPDTRPYVIAAEPLRARAERLADGSRVLLAGGSAVEVRLDPDLRRLRLVRGRARLDLSDGGGRPALIRAGPAAVTTEQARLDVAVVGADARVIVLAGEVRLAAYDDDVPRPTALRLEPGQLVTIGTRGRESQVRAATAAELAWPAGMISFVDAPLIDVLAHANATNFTRIDVADPKLADLKVTGAYEIGDPAGLARSLAVSLGLSVRQTGRGYHLIRASR